MIIILRYEFKDSGERCFLAPSLEFSAGSSEACELVLPDALIEPRHARFFYLFGTWWVEPESRSALIRCRGKRIREATPLVPNVPIQLSSLHLKPEFTPRFQDAYEPNGEIVSSTTEVGLQPAGLAENERLRILLSVRKALADQKGQSLFDALAMTMLALVPRSSSAAILIHRENELLPLAAWPEGSAAVSFTLARRAAYGLKGFIWERALASTSSQQIDSLKAIDTALYCPVVIRHRFYGVIVINSEQFNRPLTEQDLMITREFCRITATRFREFVENSEIGVATTFISYSRSDEAEAKRVAAFLRRDGISVWMDSRQRAGDDWREQIENAIQAADSTTVLLSPASLVSPTVKWEVGLAKTRDKPVLPVIIADMGALPDEWTRLHCFDLRKDFSSQLRALSHQLTGAIS
jgi:hypothetical protein